MECCRASLCWKWEKPYRELSCDGTVHGVLSICGQSRIRTCKERLCPHAQGVLTESETEPAARWKSFLLLSTCLIFPCTFSFKKQNVLPEIPGSQIAWGQAPWGVCLPAAHLAEKPVRHRSGRDRQAQSPGGCQSRAPAVPAELGAPRQLSGCGSGAALCPWSPGAEEWEAEGARLGGHPLWGLPKSWVAPEPGSWEGKLYLTQANWGFLDLSHQKLSSGNWFCYRISHLLCLGLPKTWYLEEKFVKWL